MSGPESRTLGECPSEEQLQAIIDGRSGMQGVRDHLAGCDACRAVVALARSATMSDLLSAHAPAETPPRLPLGAAVGRYVILDLIGSGGMGMVYSAFDPDLGRKVALKLLHPAIREGTRGDVVRGRLMREAQAMARLHHPNVITVYDVGSHGDDLFIAMSLVDGVTLNQWLKEKVRTWREIAGVFLKAGAGLAAAHSAGLVHRDFKPDNVLIARTGEVFVTDFGVARLVDVATEDFDLTPTADGLSSSDSGSLTMPGVLVGTPAYMAPEQLLGGAVDVKADQFSFCSALYEALYGKRPFAAQSLVELRRRLRDGLVHDPGKRGVPFWLHRVVLRGLHIKPDERYPSMAALLRDLARDPSARLRGRAFVVVAAAVLGMVAVATWTAIQRRALLCSGGGDRVAQVWNDARRAELERAFAATGRATAKSTADDVARVFDDREGAWASAHRESCEATRLRGAQSDEMLDLRMACLENVLTQDRELVLLFIQADGSLVDRAGSAVRSLDAPSRCAAETLVRGNVHLPPPGPLRARAAEIGEQLAKARALQSAGRYRDGALIASAASEAAEREQLTTVIAEAHYWQGVFETHLGHRDAGETYLHRAAVSAQATSQDEVAVRAYSFLGGPSVLGSQPARFKEAHLALDTASGILARMGGGSRDLQAYHLRHEASLFTSEKRFDEALDRYRRAMELRRQESGEESMHMAELSMGMTKALTDAGRHDEALASVRRAVAMYEHLFGPDYPFLATALLHEGFVLKQLHRYDEALAAMRRSAAIQERARGEHPTLVEALLYLGAISVEAHRPEEAIPVLERAIEVGDRIDTPEADVPSALGHLAGAFLALGREGDARQAFQRAIDHPKAGDLGADLGVSELGLAKILWSMPAERRRAIELGRRAQATFAQASAGDLVQERAEAEAWLRTHAR